MALDAMIREQRERDVIFDIVRNLGLYDKSKQFDVKAEVEKLMPILKEKKIDPSSEALHKNLDEARNNLERTDPGKAKKILELQEELKKRKLE
jgi:hypothetical protein